MSDEPTQPTLQPEIKETQSQEKARILKESNDIYEKELTRTEELNARAALGGRALAGTPEKTDKEKADEEAKRLLSIYR